jgi:hypothetical protein
MTTFVRGAAEGAVLAAFGVVEPGFPTKTGRAPWPERYDRPVLPSVQVGRLGEWIVVMGENIPAEGTRAEVLRRMPAGSEAVSVYYDIGKYQHEFGYAVGGEVVATLWAGWPRGGGGSDPQRFRPAASELGLTDDPPPESARELDPYDAIGMMIERMVGLRWQPGEITDVSEWVPILPVPRWPGAAGIRLGLRHR